MEFLSSPIQRFMWPRQWSRRLSSHATDDSDALVASPCSSPNHSFSSKDLRFLVANDAKPSVFHRIRIASSALRAWRSSALPPAEARKIVLYYTSLRIVRKTFEECRAVRSILRGFRVAVDERDLSMDSGFLSELKLLLGKKSLSLPRVFIGGRYVGGFEEIQQLHESGELKKLVEGVPAAVAGVCEACGGMSFVLCGICNGSRKCFFERCGFRNCVGCNENGLVRCPDCCGGP